MSFKIGQVLSTSIQSSALMGANVISSQAQIPIRNNITGRKFKDTCFYKKSIENISPESYFSSEKYYYVKFAIKRQLNVGSDVGQSVMRITIKLDSQTEEDYSQYIDTIAVQPVATKAELDTSPVVYYEGIIAPGMDYTMIRFILSRGAIDYYSTKNPMTGDDIDDPGSWTGRIIQFDESKCEIRQIKNLLSSNSTSLFKTSSLTKIGIQGPTGMLMCINGEAIRIGPSGIYEIKDGYKINFFSVIPKQSYSVDTNGYVADDFIVDYQYQDKTDVTTDDEDEQQGETIPSENGN